MAQRNIVPLLNGNITQTPPKSDCHLMTAQKLKYLTRSEKLSMSIGKYNGIHLGNYGEDCWLLQHWDGVANKPRSDKNLSFDKGDGVLSATQILNTSCYTIWEAARDCMWLRFSEGLSTVTLVSELRAWHVFALWWRDRYQGMNFEKWLNSPSGLDDYVAWMKQEFRSVNLGGYVSQVTQEQRLKPIYQLYQYRQLLKAGLQFPPFRGNKAADILGKKISISKHKSQKNRVGKHS
ncbi:hypothetical protein [Vibrio splendidus]|uniref:hypothetical protein n=1 Tax=Vibrio splendidus TaxID=29497 RepID=UPI002159A2B8|nr:hypothetical protein [Vibrio splendidus]